MNEQRAFLWALSYRLTGSAADADDVVQDTFVRALEAKPDPRDSLRPWLTTVATRLSLDRSRARTSLKSQSLKSQGPWLPALIATPEEEDHTPTTARYDLRESASMAFLLALEVLTPDQRAVTVLRDVFELSAREVGEVLSLTEDNVRQVHTRARAALSKWDETRAPFDAAARARSREQLEQFMEALLTNDVKLAAKVLRDDVVALNDGGGRYLAARVPVVGLERVFLFYRRLLELRTADSTEFRVCNGLWVLDSRFTPSQPSDAPRGIVGFTHSNDGRAPILFTQLAPERLPR